MVHSQHLHTGIGAEVSGGMHSNDSWGMHFETESPLSIERAIIDADTNGTFTIYLAEFTPGSGTGSVVDQQTYTVDQGYQEIHLGFEIDDPGEYLLYRDSSFTLRRIPSGEVALPDEYPFLTIIGGGNHTNGDTNGYYYYFYDMEVAVESSGGSNHVEHHDIDEYGADPTGSTPSDQALEDAAAAADPHDWIVMTNGDYLFDEYHTFTEPYTIDASGSTLECTQYNGDKSTLSQSDLYDSEEAVFHFKGSRGQGTSVASAASEGDDQIEVSDVSIFDVGDDVLVRNTGHLSRAYEPTRSQIRDVDGNTLHLHTPLKYDYTTDEAVYRIDPVVRPRVKNARFTGDAGSHVSFWYTREARVENCVSDGYRQHAYQVIDGLNTKNVDCQAKNPINLHGSHGESFRVVGSTDVTLVRPIVDGCRRGIDLRSGCKTLRVLDPQVRGATLHGICYHNGNSTAVRGSYHVKGGVISCRLTDGTLGDNPNEAQTGWAVSTSKHGEVKLVDVDVIGRRRAISAAGGGEQTLTATGCTFSTTGDDGGEEVLQIEGDQVQMTDIKVYNEGTAKEFAINIQGNDIDISGQVRGNYSSHAVIVHDVQDARLDLNIKDWNDSGAAGIRVNGDHSDDGSIVENLRITGTIEGPGRGVEILYPEVKDVTVENVSFEVGDTPALSSHWWSDATGAEDIRFIGNDVTGGSAEDIEIGAPIDGVWIKNNVASSVTGGGHSNEFIRDNKT